MPELDQEMPERDEVAGGWPGADLRTMRFATGSRELTLPQLLARIIAHLEHPDAPLDAGTAHLMHALLGAGVPALRSAAGDRAWLQYGLSCPPGSRTRLYQTLADAAHQHLGSGNAQEFFFMHKQPGLRLRFQVGTDQRAHVDQLLRTELDGWRETGIISAWNDAVYEPESHLFGGPTSMRSVHRVFTADSLAWLAFHSQPEQPGPAWAMSLVMIRALLDALSITGWEDLDVWDRLRWQAGRALDPDLVAEAGPVAAAMHGAWNDQTRLLALLAPHARAAAEAYATAIADTCDDWKADYFTAPGALVGPREASVFAIVFHWNRGDLTAARQAVIAQALAARPGATAEQPS
jgi:thiopeptide-type bacteriocin biosynthesis protein